MELSIYSLFKVDIKSLVQSKIVLCKNFNIQPSEIDRMPFWEWEISRKQAEDMAEEEKKQQEEQSKGHSMTNYQAQARRMMPNPYNNGVPRMPSMPSMPRMPRI